MWGIARYLLRHAQRNNSYVFQFRGIFPNISHLFVESIEYIYNRVCGR